MTGPSRAWGWVAHLRAGGTTPWAQWHDAAPPSGRVLPGAQQLELLRRLNLESSARPSVEDLNGRTRLAERVLGAAAAGRGKPDLPLLDDEQPGWGPEPVDPATLPADELVRVATTLLAEDLVALGVDEPRAALARPWRRHYRLVGDPLAVAHARDHLTARGYPPGGPRPWVVVLAGPFDAMLAHTWTRRCFERGSGGWPEWLRFWRDRGEVPPRLDLASAAAAYGAGRGHVRVLTDPAAVPADLAHALRVPQVPPLRVPGADAAELARRIATVVGLLVPRGVRPELMSHTLWSRMPATATPPVGVPQEHQAWVEAMAARVTRDLRRAGYPVVGDLADLAPRFDREPPGPGALDEAVLDLAVRMLVDPSWRTDDPRSVRR